MNNLNAVKNNQTEPNSKTPDFFGLELKILKVESLCNNFSKLIGSLDKPEKIIENLLKSETEEKKLVNYFEARNLRSELSDIALLGQIFIELAKEITSDLLSLEELIQETEREIMNENSAKRVA